MPPLLTPIPSLPRRSTAPHPSGGRRRRLAVRRWRQDHGQATAEYALVLLGAAAIALLLVAWATGTGKVTALLDAVVDRILDQV